MYAFTFTPENAMLFFEVCKELKAETEEDRLKIIKAMAELGKVENIVRTKMNPEDYAKHLASKFGNVLRIKGESNG
jgi:ABC-type histidine transport system ATPase subunit